MLGLELFTGNCLLTICVLNHDIKISRIVKNWVWVYIGNFIGSCIFAIMIYFSNIDKLFDGKLKELIIETAKTKCSLPIYECVIKGILCNILVCLAVWIATMVSDIINKYIAIVLPIMLFVFCGFEHSVANMYFIPMGIMENDVLQELPKLISSFLVGNLLPVTIGNILGGIIITLGIHKLNNKKEA
jgi:formate/nitrite transporter